MEYRPLMHHSQGLYSPRLTCSGETWMRSDHQLWSWVETYQQWDGWQRSCKCDNPLSQGEEEDATAQQEVHLGKAQKVSPRCASCGLQELSKFWASDQSSFVTFVWHLENAGGWRWWVREVWGLNVTWLNQDVWLGEWKGTLPEQSGTSAFLATTSGLWFPSPEVHLLCFMVWWKSSPQPTCMEGLSGHIDLEPSSQVHITSALPDLTLC